MTRFEKRQAWELGSQTPSGTAKFLFLTPIRIFFSVVLGVQKCDTKQQEPKHARQCSSIIRVSSNKESLKLIMLEVSHRDLLRDF